MSRSRCAWIWRASGTALSRSSGICIPAILLTGRPSSSANWRVAHPAISRAGVYWRESHQRRELMSKEMKEFAGLYYREGALDPKTMQLVALAAMAAAGCTS